MTTFLEETMREFDEKFVIPEGYFNLASDPEGYNTPKDIWGKYRGGDDIKEFITSRLTLQRKQMREKLERVAELEDVDELRKALSDIINALGG